MIPVRQLGAFALLTGVLVLACGEPGPAGVNGPEPPPSTGLLGGLTGLLRCDPLPADSVTRVVGPAGGTVTVGPHRLVVPSGALASDVAVTAVAPSESVRRVRFRPEGLAFAEPVELTMSYADCGLTTFLLPRIAYTTDALVILEYLPSLADGSAREVTGRLRHFSNYAVAW